MNNDHGFPKSGSCPHDRASQLIEEMACSPPGHYCLLKVILALLQRDPRTLLQIRCIEKFKYEQSARAHHDIGWEGAVNAWIAEGRADAFAKHYHEGAQFVDIYGTVMATARKA